MGRAGTGTGGAAVAAAVAGPLLLLLLARPPPATAGDCGKSDIRLVSEQFSQAPQKLSFYSWYGSARLFHFRVPPDTVLLHWLLQVSQSGGPMCSNVEITVYFRYGAPPVINPLGTSFPANTSVQPSFFVKMLQSNASINISHPAPGDWFVAAHLPPSSQKIEVKGFVPTCAYIFQPDMLVMRVVEVSILEPNVPLPQTLLSHPSYLKIFVPEYTQELRLELQGCASNGSLGCPVHLTVGSATLPSNFQKVLTCTGPAWVCHLLLPSPPWDRWLQVTAKSLAGPHVSVAFSAVVTLTACRPWIVNFKQLLQSSPNQSCNASTGLLSPSPGYQDLGRNIRSMISNNTLVMVCVNAASPFLLFNTSLNCTTAFFQGYSLSLSTSSRKAKLIIPYPETDNWYLSLQLVCPQSPEECEKAKVLIETTLYLVPCLDDCGPYGQCILLRRHGYLYAGCSCKAGWRGWSCTDNSTAQSTAQQRMATLLLTLSNLMFLAPITLSVYRCLLVEASIYAYTMFFSTFYHACDQPGEAVLCILNYDTLQYCDFLGSGVSIWVTILCMARLKAALKYVLLLLGTLVFAMSLQLDRRGAWNMMGPCLFAFVIMVTMWVYRCGHRRHCYPTSWQRWVFYLLPGISMAALAITIYTSMMTSDNYYYTHSIWHMLLAGSAAFLLPPRDKHVEPWACSQKFTCHYQICKNHREELYTVT
ncbi:post-GPI attachment to proteins factor 6 isoform X3 [Rousettus aegyptiacus]|nr:post-GPI attachment to proteins factor 6 isoform X3 [Rousettus aegyptiacus]